MGILDFVKKVIYKEPEEHEISSREYGNWNEVPSSRFEDWVSTVEDDNETSENWHDFGPSKQNIDFEDALQRREYIENCLMQMTEASRALESLEMEYKDVTSHLRDMEEIEELPPQQRKELELQAQKVLDNQNQREAFMNRHTRMNEAEFEKMQRLQKEARTSAKKLREAEEYHKKIKNDLRRIDNEHQAYLYSKEELEKTIVNTRKLMIVCAITLVFVLIALFLMGQALEINVVYGYMAAILLTAIGITVLYTRNNSAQSEIKGVNNTISRLIQLQNTVKIRYVNNKNLLDYMCLKYGVSDSAELENLYDTFLQERDQREQFKAAEKNLDTNQKQLVALLRKLRINDPEIWLHQISAIFNPNDAEIRRHDLVVQRQSLRKRMDYNRDVVAGNAKAEIELLAKEYPEYTQEILDMVSRYEEKYPMV
ncbi:MAG: hypothetical protein K6A23_01470 [Butyrivibrio sp.]|nr:hypothetical protein [Butyrivibrio sp.]